MWSRHPSIFSNVVSLSFRRSTQQLRQTLPLGTELKGKTGRIYRLERVMSHREDPFTCVYLAQDSNGRKHVLKAISKSEFEYQLSLQRPLVSCLYLRVVADSIPEHLLFVYNHLSHDPLQIGRENMNAATRKRILRDALRGLAELHGRGIVHTDIKPDNILVDLGEKPPVSPPLQHASLPNDESSIVVKSVQVADLENAADPPPGKSIKGPLLGNHMWRSPGAHVRSKANTPSDVFSFGIVCIYVMLDMILFQLPPRLPTDENMKVPYVLEKQFFYFADGVGVKGFQTHVGPDSPWQDTFVEIMSRLSRQDNPPRPFTAWAFIDDVEFIDVVAQMTKIDPAQRITAQDALEHPWFRDIEG